MAKINKADIWLPMYVGDYLSDTMHLTTEQHGAYLLLIFAYWKNTEPLIASPQRLAAICKMTLDIWVENEAILAEFFDLVDTPGKWVHHRIDKEISRAIKQRDIASEKGRRGGIASGKAKKAKKELEF